MKTNTCVRLRQFGRLPLLAVLVGLLIAVCAQPSAANIRWYGPRTQWIPPRGPFANGYITITMWGCYQNKSGSTPMYVLFRHVHNGTPPVPYWVEVEFWEFGRVFREHFSLRPGQSTGPRLFCISPGHIGYIRQRVIIPIRPIIPFPFPRETYSQTSRCYAMTGATNAPLEPVGAATSEIASEVALTPASQRTAFVDSTGVVSASQDTTFSYSGNSQVSFEDWNSASDAGFRRHTTETTTALPDGFIQTEEVDEDENGTIDRRVTREFHQAPGSMTLTIEERTGGNALLNRLHAQKIMGPGSVSMTTEIDSDGDGIINERDFENQTTSGATTEIQIQRDLDANGSIDETETTTLVFNGPNSSSQTTELRDAGGILRERRTNTVTPVGNGFVILEQTDNDGNGSLDNIVRHTWTPGDPDANNDVTLVEIDNGADGIFDRSMRVTGNRQLAGTVYTDSVVTDIDNNGSIDARVDRTVVFTRNDVPAIGTPLLVVIALSLSGGGAMVLRRRNRTRGVPAAQ